MIKEYQKNLTNQKLYIYNYVNILYNKKILSRIIIF